MMTEKLCKMGPHKVYVRYYIAVTQVVLTLYQPKPGRSQVCLTFNVNKRNLSIKTCAHCAASMS